MRSKAGTVTTRCAIRCCCASASPASCRLFTTYARDARCAKILRERWNSDLKNLAAEFRLSEAEYQALKDPDPRRLMDLGVHQYLVPHILRLTYGVTGFTNTHPAMLAYQKAFPEEARRAI